MTVKIILKYADGSDHGRSVTTTEIWEGNVIPLSKILEAIKSVSSANGEKLQRTKLVKEMKN